MVNNKLKKINIKNRTCYYLHDLRKKKILILKILQQMKNQVKIFISMILDIKFHKIQIIF